MMFQTLSLLALVASANAFAPAGFGARASTLLKADSAEAIKEAMAASEKFGASSPEARSAWDVVEEIDASTRHHKSDDIHTKETEAFETKETTPTSNGLSAEAQEWAQKRDEALAEAKRLTEEKGASDPDSRIAWELVEELSATASHHAKTGSG